MTTLPVEIERKFHLPRLPQVVSELIAEKISQGYLAVEHEKNEVRIRKRDTKYFMTVKSSGTIKRNEVEFSINEHTFEKLWVLTQDRRIEKERFTYKYSGLDIEIDHYHGALAGLCIAEIEFKSIHAAEQFVAPTWFGKEVTNNPHFKNRYLSLTPDVNSVISTL